MPVGESVGSITAVVIAIGTVILVVYTPFGHDVRRRTIGLVGSGRATAAKLINRGDHWRRRHLTVVVAALLLITVWSLATPSFIAALAARDVWSWTLRALAGVTSTLALVIAYKGQSSIAPHLYLSHPGKNGLQPDSLNAASRRMDLLRQAYALAGAMLKYMEPSGMVAWNDVQQYNTLIYQLGGEGLDLTAFAIAFIGAKKSEDDDAWLIPSSQVARQLEGLIVYARESRVDNRPGAAERL